jgi:hypothetical protein
MQPVYRAAKAVDEQLKAGADLSQLHRLEGNLATELAFVHDRMKRDPSLDKLLRPRDAAYQAALQSYTLATDVIEYHQASERCIGPRHEPADAAHRKRKFEWDSGCLVRFAETKWHTRKASSWEPSPHQISPAKAKRRTQGALGVPRKEGDVVVVGFGDKARTSPYSFAG